jgi:hypothetical protein
MQMSDFQGKTEPKCAVLFLLIPQDEFVVSMACEEL